MYEKSGTLIQKKPQGFLQCSRNLLVSLSSNNGKVDNTWARKFHSHCTSWYQFHRNYEGERPIKRYIRKTGQQNRRKSRQVYIVTGRKTVVGQRTVVGSKAALRQRRNLARTFPSANIRIADRSFSFINFMPLLPRPSYRPDRWTLS